MGSSAPSFAEMGAFLWRDDMKRCPIMEKRMKAVGKAIKIYAGEPNPWPFEDIKYGEDKEKQAAEVCRLFKHYEESEEYALIALKASTPHGGFSLEKLTEIVNSVYESEGGE
jgi:hypothetical protein